MNPMWFVCCIHDHRMSTSHPRREVSSMIAK
jgi:hypothetical protein